MYPFRVTGLALFWKNVTRFGKPRYNAAAKTGQGRMCERSVSAAIAEALSGERADYKRVGHYLIRPPLHPLPAQFLAEAQVETRE
jgi:hypothetical protein